MQHWNRHNRKTSPEWLFQVQANSYKLHVFCIPKKEFKTYELDFTFLYAVGFYLVEMAFYLGGGTPAWLQYSFQLRKLKTNGNTYSSKRCRLVRHALQWPCGERKAVSLQSEDTMELVWTKSKNTPSLEISGNSIHNSLKLSVIHQLSS